MMNCHGGGGRKNTWLIVLTVAALGIGLFALLSGRGLTGLTGLMPFMALLLCPLMHGAIFLFMGKQLAHGAHDHQQNAAGQGEPGTTD